MTFPLKYKVDPGLAAAQISMKSALVSRENVQAISKDKNKASGLIKNFS